MVNNFHEGQALSYQVYVTTPGKGKAVTVRYSGYSNCTCEVEIDGSIMARIDMPRTGGADIWVEAFGYINGLKSGAHTVTLRLLSGSCYLSGWQISGTDD